MQNTDKKTNKQIIVLGKEITISKDEYISITDMLKAKDGEFFNFGLATKSEYS